MKCCLRGIMYISLLTVLMMRVTFISANAEMMDFQMNVGQLEQKRDSHCVGSRHKWYIRVDLPKNWEGIDSFVIHQTLSVSLELDPESVYVRLLEENGERTLLRMGEHYEVTAGSVFVEEGTADRFCVSFTSEGKTFLSDYQNSDSQLLIVYTAKISTSAAVGRQIVGSAQLDITDTEGKRAIFLSDKAATETGGIHILLTSLTDDPIDGGKFMLARETTRKEREDQSVLKEHLDTGEETILVVYENFYTTEDMDGEKTDIATTDSSGNALCYGLAYGTYYLVQIENQSAEYLEAEPVRIGINEVSHLTEKDGWKDSRGNPVDNTIHITNTMLVMPQTGGIGTQPYTIAGCIAILCAFWLFRRNRKNNAPC